MSRQRKWNKSNMTSCSVLPSASTPALSQESARHPTSANIRQLVDLVIKGVVDINKLSLSESENFWKMASTHVLGKVFCPVKCFAKKQNNEKTICFFDQSGSMQRSEFFPLVQKMFKDSKHDITWFEFSMPDRIYYPSMKTSDMAIKYNYYPGPQFGGGTYMGPAFTRAQRYEESHQNQPYNLVIFCDGGLHDSIHQYAQLRNVTQITWLFPSWSPSSAIAQHRESIKTLFPGKLVNIVDVINSTTDFKPYFESGSMIADVQGLFTVGSICFPQILLNPSYMMQSLIKMIERNDKSEIEVVVPLIMEAFQTLFESLRTDLISTLQNDQFKNMMQLITPLMKFSEIKAEDFSIFGPLFFQMKQINDQLGTIKQCAINAQPDQAEFLNEIFDQAKQFCEADLIMSGVHYHHQISGANVDPLWLSDHLYLLRALHSGEQDAIQRLFGYLETLTITSKSVSNEFEVPFVPQDFMKSIQMFTIIGADGDSKKKWTLSKTSASRFALVVLTAIIQGKIKLHPELQKMFKRFPQDLPEKIRLSLIDFDDATNVENRSPLWIEVLQTLAPQLKIPKTTLNSINEWQSYISNALATKSKLTSLPTVTCQRLEDEGAPTFSENVTAKCWALEAEGVQVKDVHIKYMQKAQLASMHQGNSCGKDCSGSAFTPVWGPTEYVCKQCPQRYKGCIWVCDDCGCDDFEALGDYKLVNYNISGFGHGLSEEGTPSDALKAFCIKEGLKGGVLNQHMKTVLEINGGQVPVISQDEFEVFVKESKILAREIKPRVEDFDVKIEKMHVIHQLCSNTANSVEQRILKCCVSLKTDQSVTSMAGELHDNAHTLSIPEPSVNPHRHIKTVHVELMKACNEFNTFKKGFYVSKVPCASQKDVVFTDSVVVQPVENVIDSGSLFQQTDTYSVPVPSPNTSKLCCVCLTNENSHVIIPCGHKCVCEDCGSQIDKCPICRQHFTSLFKVFE